jgi:hypothetical protein
VPPPLPPVPPPELHDPVEAEISTPEVSISFPLRPFISKVYLVLQVKFELVYEVAFIHPEFELFVLFVTR